MIYISDECCFISDQNYESWDRMSTHAEKGKLSWLKSDPSNDKSEIKVLACIAPSDRKKCVSANCELEAMDFLLFIKNEGFERKAKEISVMVSTENDGSVGLEKLRLGNWEKIQLRANMGRRPQFKKDRINMGGLPRVELDIHIMRPDEQEEAAEGSALREVSSFKVVAV